MQKIKNKSRIKNKWKIIIDFTKIKKEGINIKNILHCL